MIINNSSYFLNQLQDEQRWGREVPFQNISRLLIYEILSCINFDHEETKCMWGPVFAYI